MATGTELAGRNALGRVGIARPIDAGRRELAGPEVLVVPLIVLLGGGSGLGVERLDELLG
ncbi:MAG TPA: hypothetical protein VME19_15450 [Streptosporangiaceae bacterium]|nr:hypothetical protein [Streptosporangiaceae bacterium]